MLLEGPTNKSDVNNQLGYMWVHVHVVLGRSSWQCKSTGYTLANGRAYIVDLYCQSKVMGSTVNSTTPLPVTNLTMLLFREGGSS